MAWVDLCNIVLAFPGAVLYAAATVCLTQLLMVFLCSWSRYAFAIACDEQAA